MYIYFVYMLGERNASHYSSLAADSCSFSLVPYNRSLLLIGSSRFCCVFVVLCLENHYTAHILLASPSSWTWSWTFGRAAIVLILFLIALLQFFLKNNKILASAWKSATYSEMYGLGYVFMCVCVCVCLWQVQRQSIWIFLRYILENADALLRSRHEYSEVISS